MVRIGKSTPFCSLCKYRPSALRLATLLAGRRREEEGSGDRVTAWLSAGQHTDLRLWRVAV